MVSGRIHSIESMGLVDGPGVRCVVFMQGCKIRCLYCHNPDTWALSDGKVTTAEDLMVKIRRFKPYFKNSGGVTFSGGEPLIQHVFLIEMLKRCKMEGIHTALDTAGAGNGHYDEILENTDLVLLDVKHTDPEKYREITRVPIDEFYKFLECYKRSNADAWIRSVIVPGINDNIEYISDLWEFVKTVPRVKKIELLPYHKLGVNKYEEIGMDYPLEDVPAMDKEQTKKWQDMLNKIILSEEKGAVFDNLGG